ncbi:hypothetical protein PMm318_A37840 [Pseudomonas moorei]
MSNEASKFFLYFMIRRSEIIIGGSELLRAAQTANETTDLRWQVPVQTREAKK